jgi:arsenate reductase-like glutaredoxin family protein
MANAVTSQAALVIMILDPSLIRRPLMRVNGRAEAGFDREAVDDWIGLKPKAPAGTGRGA